jgi:glycolate oxidase iron-sulfur subunit
MIAGRALRRKPRGRAGVDGQSLCPPNLAESDGFPENGPVTATPPCTLPTALSLQALTDQCVQCGLCLPTCPTYAFDPIEAESPRGRIALIKAWESGLSAPTEAGDRHLDQCLGCRRCEAVCPAGVAYGPILTRARVRQRARRAQRWRQRGAELLAARSDLRGAVLGLYRWLWPLLPATLRLLPRPHRAMPPPTAAAKTHDSPEVAVFIGCIAHHYEGPARQALIALLNAIGLRASFPGGQTCCGALHAHGGDTTTALRLEADNAQAFAQANVVLSLASGCHEAVADGIGEHVTDAIAFLERHADALAFAPRRERIALHLPCTQRYVVRSDSALRALLARVPELDVVVIDAGFGCCGAAGIQMLTDPGRAARFRQPLLDQLAASGATRLLSANIGCRLHLANGTALPVHHPLEFLSECLA